MRLKFTKMQGAGNDFIVLDATRAPIALERSQWRWLADRRFGIGADQILIVGPPADATRADFSYRIFNADGGEVEHCGTGARAFARFVREKGLSDRDAIQVETLSGLITPSLAADGSVTVDMGPPRFELAAIGFDASGLVARTEGAETIWPLPLSDQTLGARAVAIGIVSMGNPHAVTVVDDVDTAPVAVLGPLIEGHVRFRDRVNAGFMQVVDAHAIRLRVHERGAGETLACGTGACAAVVSGIRRGLLASPVTVHARGGDLVVAWQGDATSVTMSGPAATVFVGEVTVPAAAQVSAAFPH